MSILKYLPFRCDTVIKTILDNLVAVTTLTTAFYVIHGKPSPGLTRLKENVKFNIFRRKSHALDYQNNIDFEDFSNFQFESNHHESNM